MATNGQMVIRSRKDKVFLRTWINGYSADAVAALMGLPWKMTADAVKRANEDDVGTYPVWTRTEGCWFISTSRRVRRRNDSPPDFADAVRFWRAGLPVEIDLYLIAKWFTGCWFNSWHVVTTQADMKKVRPGMMVEADYDGYGMGGLVAKFTCDDEDGADESAKGIRELLMMTDDAPADLRPVITVEDGRTVVGTVPFSDTLAFLMCAAAVNLAPEERQQPQPGFGLPIPD